MKVNPKKGIRGSMALVYLPIPLLLLLDFKLSCLLLYILLCNTSYLLGGKRQAFIFSASFSILSFFLFACYLVYGNYQFCGIETDDYAYEMDALEFYKYYGIDWSKIYEILPINHNSVGYVCFLSLFHRWGAFFDGYSHFLPIISNVFLLTTSGYYLEQTGLLYGINPKICLRSNLVWSLYPSLLQITGFVFRDILVSFFIIVCFYSVIKRKSFWGYVFIIICLISLFFLREQAAIMMLFLVVLFHFNISKLNWKVLLILAIAACALIVIIMNSGLLDVMENYKDMREETSGGVVSKVMNMPYYISFIPRICLLSIMPFIVPEFTQAIAGLSGLAQFFIMPLVLFALFDKKVDMKLKVGFLLFFVGVSFSSFTFRHITMYLPFAFLLIMNCLKNKITSRIYIRFFTFYAMLWFTTVFLLIL